MAFTMVVMLVGLGVELGRATTVGVATALVEASTRHMDNLVLPLMVFLLLR